MKTRKHIIGIIGVLAVTALSLSACSISLDEQGDAGTVNITIGGSARAAAPEWLMGLDLKDFEHTIRVLDENGAEQYRAENLRYGSTSSFTLTPGSYTFYVTAFYNGGQIATGREERTIHAGKNPAIIIQMGPVGPTGGKTLTDITVDYISDPDNTIFTDTKLDTLREGLTVTAHYSDDTTAPVTNYTLSVEGGALTVGENTVTVTYIEGGVIKTGTFTVTAYETHPHNWSKISETAPTCTTAGVEVWECTAVTPSHHEDRPIPIDPNAHDAGEWHIILAATCSATGIRELLCTRDNFVLETGIIAIDPNAHDWETVSTAATETTDGMEGRVCNNDHAHDEITITSYATGTPELYFQLIMEGTNVNTYRVRKGTITTDVVYIPAYHRTDANSPYLPVTEIGSQYDIEIGSGAFEGTAITAVHIPDSVTSIGAAAFCECTGLTEITIPDSVTSIGVYAFQTCTGLTGITIPDSVTSIGKYVFEGCTGLTSVSIGAGVTSTDDLFANCTGLISISIGAGVTSITSNKFPNPTSLTSITVDGNNPNYASQDGILYNNKAKTDILILPQGISGAVTLSASLTSISSQAFVNRTGLTGITIPSGVINNQAFQGCTGLTSISIGAGVTSIGSQAFQNCTNLTNVTISSGAIGSQVFQNCTSLTGITIGAGVTTIAVDAFWDCAGLTAITVDGNNPDYSSAGGILYNKTKTELIVNLSASSAVIIPASVTSIGSYAFRNCTGLTSITLPENLTSIGERAFQNCYGLTGITIPENVASVSCGTSTSSFAGCTNLRNIIIDTDKVTTTDTSNWGHAFPASNLSVTFTKNPGFCAFNDNSDSGNNRLTSVTFEEGVTAIGQAAFRGCSGLTSVTIPASVTNIEPFAFIYCTYLTSVTFSGDNVSMNSQVSPGGPLDIYGDLHSKYNGRGTYTRQVGSSYWTKQP